MGTPLLPPRLDVDVKCPMAEACPAARTAKEAAIAAAVETDAEEAAAGTALAAAAAAAGRLGVGEEKLGEQRGDVATVAEKATVGKRLAPL
mmetsp:Transcript_140002/g.348926  ORF Transcript_140002/g.348926 Transcript_140002/m.348926 type:complete len:91 (+) Transcript_140002:199-471(+)